MIGRSLNALPPVQLHEYIERASAEIPITITLSSKLTEGAECHP